VSVNLILAVAGCQLKTGVANGSVTHSMIIPYNIVEIPAKTFEFNLPLPQGSFTLITAALQYNVATKSGVQKTNDPSWLPAGVLNARYS
jgi:hypothetical protein